MSRKIATPAALAGVAFTLFAVLATIVWLGVGVGKPTDASDGGNSGETPTEAAKTCEGLAYVSAAPIRSDLAFGPDVRTEIDRYDQLSESERVEAVVAHQLATWCKFPAIALANAMHRGLVQWPSSPDEWLERLKVLTEDRQEHLKLVERLLEWESNQVIRYEIVYNHDKYMSDWFDRSSGTPVLVRGNGHDIVAGWVVRRTLKDGTVLEERLECDYQLAGEVPPLTPPPPPPSTTEVGKDARTRPSQPPVVNCPSGQYADRSGHCQSTAARTTTVYNNSGGDSGDGAPGPGSTLPPTDTSLWSPGDGGGGGSLPPPGE